MLGNHDAKLVDAIADPLTPQRSARKVVDQLEAADPDALAWLVALPLFLDLSAFTIVHAGLHPSGDLAQTTYKMAITLRRWPDELTTDPHWHSVYHGDRRVIFGHDALRGLVRVERAGVPWLIGLDTGCVYGGALSGYIVEEDRVVSVRAARVYRPIG